MLIDEQGIIRSRLEDPNEWVCIRSIAGKDVQQIFDCVHKLVSGDGGGGTLTVSNAPSIVDGKFEAIPQTVVDISRNKIKVVWTEQYVYGTHREHVNLSADLTTGKVKTLAFDVFKEGELTNMWGCGYSSQAPCQGVVTVNRSAGTAVFSDVVIPTSNPRFIASPITLNGTLNFAPR
jgi:hypothetical protein